MIARVLRILLIALIACAPSTHALNLSSDSEGNGTNHVPLSTISNATNVDLSALLGIPEDFQVDVIRAGQWSIAPERVWSTLIRAAFRLYEQRGWLDPVEDFEFRNLVEPRILDVRFSGTKDTKACHLMWALYVTSIQCRAMGYYGPVEFQVSLSGFFLGQGTLTLPAQAKEENLTNGSTVVSNSSPSSPSFSSRSSGSVVSYAHKRAPDDLNEHIKPFMDNNTNVNNSTNPIPSPFKVYWRPEGVHLPHGTTFEAFLYMVVQYAQYWPYQPLDAVQKLLREDTVRIEVGPLASGTTSLTAGASTASGKIQPGDVEVEKRRAVGGSRLTAGAPFHCFNLVGVIAYTANYMFDKDRYDAAFVNVFQDISRKTLIGFLKVTSIA